jgi:TonB-dependent SusC/RagA subfamily outer membrane receptor
MDNKDTLFNKIKSAAENAENQDFPGMEKVWSRIDAKLDTKVEKKHNNNWKKLMIAASILLVISIGYQFIKSDEVIVVPQNEVVTKDSIKPIIENTLENQNALVQGEELNPNIKENAAEILEEQIKKPNTVAVAESVEETKRSENGYLELDKNLKPESTPSKHYLNSASSNNSGTWMGSPKFESRGVEYKEAQKADEMEISNKNAVAKKEQKAKKVEPLVIVDDKITDKKVSDLADEDVDIIVELKEPLYIINGIEYTELEMFGPNPTSPYSPLNKQEIESFTVLQPEKATSIYGEKGKKGVVIVTTKNGKPSVKKKN